LKNTKVFDIIAFVMKNKPLITEKQIITTSIDLTGALGYGLFFQSVIGVNTSTCLPWVFPIRLIKKFTPTQIK